MTTNKTEKIPYNGYLWDRSGQRFTKDLGIKSNEKTTINNDEFTTKISNSNLRLNSGSSSNEVRTYCIDNIAKLLQLSPHFENQKIQEKIKDISEKDAVLLQTRDRFHRSLGIILQNDLLGPGRPYILHNGVIWYSSGISQDGAIRRPTAQLITNDTRYFHPLNIYFSEDSTQIYWKNTCVCEKVQASPKHVQALKNSDYLSYGDKVYHITSEIEGAMVSGDYYEIIQNNMIDILKDSNGNFFSGYKKLDIKHPERCERVMENFLFDGECVYMIVGEDAHNLTEKYGLPPHETISKDEKNVYTVGDVSFTYDGLMDINFL